MEGTNCPHLPGLPRLLLASFDNYLTTPSYSFLSYCSKVVRKPGPAQDSFALSFRLQASALVLFLNYLLTLPASKKGIQRQLGLAASINFPFSQQKVSLPLTVRPLLHKPRSKPVSITPSITFLLFFSPSTHNIFPASQKFCGAVTQSQQRNGRW